MYSKEGHTRAGFKNLSRQYMATTCWRQNGNTWKSNEIRPTGYEVYAQLTFPVNPGETVLIES